MRSWALISMEKQRFGALVVVKRAGSIRQGGKNKYAAWLCRCDCGQEVVVSGQRLRRGQQKTCARNGHRWNSVKPGVAGLNPLEYRAWLKMHARCKDVRRHNYKNYGGRGIKVCERWAKFENFFQDMGSKPTPQHTLERIDNNGFYELTNCRWATRAEQARNTTRSVFVLYGGKPVLLVDICKQFNISIGVVYGRLKRNWGLDEALTKPVRAKKKNHA